ncbi:MAG TPA: hypothetical protein PJ990_05470, partial [Saprospiraceae bacterium]|nr:hypothetical protein [Saprospiraceae bacterium]
MVFDNNINTNKLLYPILFGLIAFIATVTFLNYSLKWPEKQIISKSGNIIAYKPATNFASSSIPDTLFSPHKVSLFHNENVLQAKRFIYNRHPLLLIWVMTVGVLIGFGFSFIPIFTNKIREYGFKWSYFIFATIFIFLLFLPQFMGTQEKVHNLIMPRDIHDIFGIGFTK